MEFTYDTLIEIAKIFAVSSIISPFILYFLKSKVPTIESKKLELEKIKFLQDISEKNNCDLTKELLFQSIYGINLKTDEIEVLTSYKNKNHAISFYKKYFKNLYIINNRIEIRPEYKKRILNGKINKFRAIEMLKYAISGVITTLIVFQTSNNIDSFLSSNLTIKLFTVSLLIYCLFEMAAKIFTIKAAEVSQIEIEKLQ